MNILNEIKIYYPVEKGSLLMKYIYGEERPFVVLLKKASLNAENLSVKCFVGN